MIKRRIGPHPHRDGRTSSADGCPDIFELDSGDFAVIGIDKTDLLRSHLPKDASCAIDEKIVVIDRHVLVGAKSDIPLE